MKIQYKCGCMFEFDDSSFERRDGKATGRNNGVLQETYFSSKSIDTAYDTQRVMEMAINKSKGKLLKCGACGHSWRYKGSLGIATCASCGSKVRTEIGKKEVRT